MVSGTATRPGDVLTMYGGKTVEVLNTDAEGRLVLADALVRATEQEPDLIVDVATLTGACVIALGDRVAGVFGNDDALVAQTIAAGRARRRDALADADPPEMTGEGAHGQQDRRPGPARLDALGRRALRRRRSSQEFVGDAPWAHLDIAGPAFNTGPATGTSPPAAPASA